MTIADDFMAGAVISTHSQENKLRLQNVAAWIGRRLAPAPGASVLEMRVLAERYVFEGSPLAAVAELQRLGDMSYELVLEAVGLVSNPSWIEMQITYESGRNARLGCMVEEHGGRLYVAYVVQDREIYNGRPIVLGALSAPALPWREGDKIPTDVISWTTERDPSETEVGTYLFDVTDALFLLCTPKVSEIRQVQHHRKLQAARERRGKSPLLEYKHVRLVIGQGQPQYRGAREGAGVSEIHHRMHRVEGHVRVYRKGRERPLVAFVPEHWRGNPELGILLHEKTVR